MKHASEDVLILYASGEVNAEARREVTAHLAACAECRKSLEAFQRLFAAAGTLTVPERPEDYEQEVWRRLRPHLAARPETRWGAWLAPQRWALAGAMAAMLAVAFLAGRYSKQHQAPLAALSPQVRERILLVTVGEHLDRSQMLLIELEHADGKGPVDIAAQKRRAADLVASNRLYRQTAARAGDAGIENVLDDLERTLLQIAHSPSELTPAELERLQRRIEAQGILFKVRVIRSQVREKEAQSAREVARRTL